MQPRNSSASALGLLCHSKSCCKQQIHASHHRYNTASCAPARRDVDRVFCPLVRSFLRVASPGQYALMLWLFSCRCDSSFRDGRRPGRFVLRSPGSAFPIRNRGFLRVGGDAPQSAHRGDGAKVLFIQICSHADRMPIYNGAVSSAAGCWAAACAAFAASFFAAIFAACC